VIKFSYSVFIQACL